MAVELKQALVDTPYEPAETAVQAKRSQTRRWRLSLTHLAQAPWRVWPLLLMVLTVAIAGAAFDNEAPLPAPSLSQLPLLLMMTEKPVHHAKP